VKDQLNITLTNDSSAGATNWTVTIHGVSYTVGSAYTAPGNVTMGGMYVSGATAASPPASGVSVASNATVADYKVTANTPPVGVQPNSLNQPISNIVVTEYAPGVVSAGNYTTSSGGTFSNTSHPTFSVTGGNAIVNPTVTVSAGELTLHVLVASTTGPAVYTLSGLIVNATGGANFSGPVFAQINSLPPDPGVVIYTVIGSSRIQGQVATDTSAALFQRNGCNSTAVLATSDNYPDALTAAYLASTYNYETSVIITPTAAVALVTLNALRFEGVQTVMVVGGPLAISPADIATLQSTPAYDCGGTDRSTGGWPLYTPLNLSVTQIWGQDQYGTAQQVAQYVAASNIGTVMTPGAYGGTYNDTSGANGTAAASVSHVCLRTAILATGVNFPDAMAASATSWENGLPILLTEKGSLAPEASAAILNLGIQQVIVMGGPDAISDNVLTQLEAMGVTAPGPVRTERPERQQRSERARLEPQL
jgi:putative cell wall-binding protein